MQNMTNANQITLELPVSEQHLGMICSELLKLATNPELAKEAMQELKLFINALVRDEDFGGEQHKLFETTIDEHLDEFLENAKEARKTAQNTKSVKTSDTENNSESRKNSENKSDENQANHPIAVVPPTHQYLAKTNGKMEYIEPQDPEKPVCMLAKGEAYLRYQMMSSRLLFSESMNELEKDSAILDLSLLLLEREMNKISRRTNRQFVNADYLYFVNNKEQQ